MPAPFLTQAIAQEIKPGEFMCPIPITVNDRAATREAIIKKARSLNATFVERSSWGAAKGKPGMVMDWDYSMIALHHAGRSHSCTPGGGQMQEIQKGHMGQAYDDIGYHYGIDCTGQIFEGRDIRFQGSSVLKFNTGLIGIVLLENLTTPEEGGDWVAKGRVALDSIGYSTTNVIPAAQITALMHLIESLKSVFVIKHFGGHREYPGQASEGKICPGNIGMELVRNLRTKTQLLPPPAPQE
ncbi:MULTISPECIES: peptidoglycan recognition family protein [Pseudomonas]|uniref:Peptidoglycan recognition family protein n=1 Tax=Pseudomonas wuhanensis TaxID=2954098 RepID=A0ABY9GPC7_9PSED|nr:MULTISPECIES: peptidoglycan recognition family protein [unclassified Pseudomonas]WLI11672.1 peptidoglycan recognition family protein [Pseudomonas sp. FP603]WLI17513.1 peptidoglycan recognition family protein [Pseudomonas sp. FP607]